jgi:DNA-directed RNA polymerase specialized sigma24 family protein
MQGHSTVTDWIQQLKTGSSTAAQKIWERYAQALITLAHRKLAARGVDEEDIVQQAFEAFFRAAQAGRLPRLSDRQDLWALLIKITENKVIDQRRRERSRKRGPDGTETSLVGLGDPQPSPEFVAEAIDQYEHLLAAPRRAAAPACAAQDGGPHAGRGCPATGLRAGNGEPQAAIDSHDLEQGDRKQRFLAAPQAGCLA